MSFSNTTHRTATSIIGVLLITLSSAVFAADAPTAASSAPTKQMRDQMASLHEQMAACLRSDTSISDCRTQMQKHCQDMMGKQGCTMMMGTGGMMGVGQGMHGHMTSNQPPRSSSPQ